MPQHIAARTALFALTLSLLGACASQLPGSRIAARVVSLKSGSSDARGLEPVAGAHVAVECPAKESREVGMTDADGTLRVDADAAVGLDCTLNVAHSGHRPVKLAVSQVCVTQAGAECRTLDIRAVLQPEASPTSAGATH